MVRVRIRQRRVVREVTVEDRQVDEALGVLLGDEAELRRRGDAIGQSRESGEVEFHISGEACSCHRHRRSAVRRPRRRVDRADGHGAVRVEGIGQCHRRTAWVSHREVLHAGRCRDGEHHRRLGSTGSHEC